MWNGPMWRWIGLAHTSVVFIPSTIILVGHAHVPMCDPLLLFARIHTHAQPRSALHSVCVRLLLTILRCSSPDRDPGLLSPVLSYPVLNYVFIVRPSLSKFPFVSEEVLYIFRILLFDL